MPLVEDELKKTAGDSENVEELGFSGLQLVTSDGTYATQSAFIMNAPRSGQSKRRPPLRQYLIDGDFYTGAALGTTFTKLGIRYAEIWGGQDPIKSNTFCVNLMLILTYILKLGKSGNYIFMYMYWKCMHKTLFSIVYKYFI